jgi:hypothetical protein
MSRSHEGEARGMTKDMRTEAALDLGVVRDALRAELSSRGHEVASDTMGMRRVLYIIGVNDLARALFEFGTDAGDLAEAMYRSSGSWAPGMPPRFAVLPAAEADSPSVEMLEQMRAVPLLFGANGGRVTFRELDRLLGEHVAP